MLSHYLKLTLPFVFLSAFLSVVGNQILNSPQLGNLLYSLPILLFAAIRTTQIILRRKAIWVNKTDIIYFLIVILYAVRGIAQGNPLGYILYDLSILSVPIVILVLSKNHVQTRKIEGKKIHSNVILALIIFAIIILDDALSQFFLFVFYLVSYGKREKNWVDYLMIFCLIAFFLIKGSKAYLLILLFNFYSIELLRKRYALPVITLVLVVGSFYIVNVYFYELVSGLSSTARKTLALVNRLDLNLLVLAFRNLDTVILWEAVDLSTGQRLFELFTVLSDLKTNNQVLLGEGLGGYANLSETHDMSIVVRREGGDVSRVRVFHLMITWFMNKVGFVGLLLFLLYLRSIFLRFRPEKMNGNFKYLYLCIWFAFFIRIFITFGGFYFYYYFPILLSVFYTINSQLRTENETVNN